MCIYMCIYTHMCSHTHIYTYTVGLLLSFSLAISGSITSAHMEGGERETTSLLFRFHWYQAYNLILFVCINN